MRRYGTKCFVDIGLELQATLAEEYSNEIAPGDGEIYRKIERYKAEGNVQSLERWESRLSETKLTRLKQLSKHERLSAAFNRLLPVPGLWGGMRLGGLGPVFSAKCDEEIINYLTYVWVFWSSLVDNDQSAMGKIDQHTVETIQLTAPGACTTDSRKVHGLIISGEVFRNFSSREREAIWGKLEEFDGLIPSLFSFFEDFKYLVACLRCIRPILTLTKAFRTVKQAMEHMFKDTHQNKNVCKIQTMEGRFRTTSESFECRFELGYRQVWLYAMRHYPEAGKGAGGDTCLADSVGKDADEATLHNMAALACDLGFESPQIKTLLESHPDRLIARNALLKARKPGQYRYPPEKFDNLVDQITQFFREAQTCEAQASNKPVADSVNKVKARCGQPTARCQKQDSPYLFLDYLHTGKENMAESVTGLFVRRCVYLAFFGKVSQPTASGLEEPATSDILDIPPLSAKENASMSEACWGKQRDSDTADESGREAECWKRASQDIQAKKRERREQRQRRKKRREKARLLRKRAVEGGLFVEADNSETERAGEHKIQLKPGNQHQSDNMARGDQEPRHGRGGNRKMGFLESLCSWR
ncbi:hypothetical protein LOZ43_006688 [Ophidiomyces ophidiicola]|nr:hypothetical protein LOZ43_006688 [Ophidiomyces ophidiicola]